MTLPAWSLPAALGAGIVLLVAWNLTLGMRLSSLPGAGRTLRTLAGLCAFLFIPSLVIGLLAPSALGARVLGPLAWLWPAVTIVFVAQAWLAISGGRASLLIAAPLLLFDGLVAWVVVVRWIESVGGMLPPWALAPGMAIATLVATVVGPAAFPWGTSLLIPALVPATPARQRWTRAARTLLAAASSAAVIVTVLELPRAHEALESTRALDAGATDAAARGGLAIGISIFGVLSASPPSTMARQEKVLADSIGVSALHVTLTSDGTGPLTLDSVARTLEPRADSVALVVTLRRDGRGGADDARSDEEIVRVVRRLRPHVFIPLRNALPGAAPMTRDAWESYYTRAAAAARRGDPRTRVALPTGAGTHLDSALVDWVMQGASPLGAVALTVEDYGASPARFVDALNALSRWASMARALPDVWVVGIPSAPTITGEVVQQRLVRHTLLWAAARPWVRGVIAGDANDVTTPSALRTATGRARRAFGEIGTALRLQRDLPPAAAPVDSVSAPDTTADTVRAIPDTLTRPRS